MDNESFTEVGEIVEAGLKSGTSMRTIKECVGQITLKRWLLELDDRTQRRKDLKPQKRK